MTRLLYVDDTVRGDPHLPNALAAELGWEVLTAERPDDLPGLLDEHGAFDVALVDLGFPNSDLNGLHALLTLNQRTPTCRLVVYTQGDPLRADILRDAWDAFDLACAMSRGTDWAILLRTLRQVAMHGSAPIDAMLQPLLPAQRARWRTPEGYGLLVKHAGHAKLWQALIDFDHEPSYAELAAHTGLAYTTVRNYRGELLGDLALHRMERPKMREMQIFAKRCRALLEPHIRRRLGEDDQADPPT